MSLFSIPSQLQQITRELVLINKQLSEIIQGEKTQVALFTDVTTALAKLGADVSAEIQAVVAAIAALQASGGATPAQLDELVKQLNTIDEVVNAETASVTPPTAPTAPPVVAPTA